MEDKKNLKKKIIIFIVVYVILFALAILACHLSGMSIRDILRHSITMFGKYRLLTSM